MSLYLTLLNTLCLCTVAIAQSLIIGNITHLGPLHSPDVTGVSRDGGTSVLLNGRITWIFDDTECLSEANQQLGFVSNSASHNKEPNANISSLQDFGIVNTGKNSQGKSEYAIRAGGSVGTGGWIPFKHTELDFNREDSGKSRVAICGYFHDTWRLDTDKTRLDRAWYKPNSDKSSFRLHLRSSRLR